jgi:hypothetical protein
MRQINPRLCVAESQPLPRVTPGAYLDKDFRENRACGSQIEFAPRSCVGRFSVLLNHRPPDDDAQTIALGARHERLRAPRLLIAFCMLLP